MPEPKHSAPSLRRLSLSSLMQQAFAHGYALAAWRLPGGEQELLLQLSPQARQVFPEVESMAPGFLFSPYEADYSDPEQPSAHSCRYLRADLLFSGSTNKAELSSRLSPEQQQQAEDFLHASTENKDASWYAASGLADGSMQAESYKQLVESAVGAIRMGHMQKVVCARSKRASLPDGFSLPAFFQQLCHAYPHAFVSVVAIPELGTWVGATPEILINLENNRIFKTMALAGTQARSPEQQPSDAVWRQKEIEEQALVSRYIINNFKKIRLREYEEVGPRTVAAANLMHLRTDFTVDMEATGFPQLGTTMLQLLHPTSAVCGMPKAEAVEFLHTYEPLDRSFFAGFLGPVNIRQQTQLFVNLRCMQLLAREALLYAGAGITADSDPEQEWKETELKCQTLLDQLYHTNTKR